MIKLASPDIRKEDIRKAVDVLLTGNLIQGENVTLFEQKLTAFTCLPYSIVVSSCTAALHLSLIALGVTKGDSVIVPAFTFPATANVVEVVGAEIILADVDKTTYTMTPESLETAISGNKDKSIKAVIIVHEFGFPAQMKAISEIAKQHDLRLIEDAACALGTVADGHHVGHFSDMACFSFHPRKAITTGEGGAVLTNSQTLAERIKSLRNHGIEGIAKKIEFTAAGLNYRMTDFQAALAIGQLGRFRLELSKRSELANKYIQLLQHEKSLQLPINSDGHSWQSFMVVLNEHTSRQFVIEKLAVNGIETSLGAHAINCLSYYLGKYQFKQDSFNNARLLYERGLVLPIYGKLAVSDIEYISRAVITALGR